MGLLFDGLQQGQREFVDAYNGNVIETAAILGVTVLSARGHFAKPEIREAIKERFRENMHPIIAERDERLAFWSEMMRNPLNDDNIRLRASELLGKANIDFGERRIVEAKITTIVPKTELEDRINQIVADDDWLT